MLTRKRARSNPSGPGESSRHHDEPPLEGTAEDLPRSAAENSAIPEATSLSIEEDRASTAISRLGSSQTLSQQVGIVSDGRGYSSQPNPGTAVLEPTTDADNNPSTTLTSEVFPRPSDVARSNVQQDSGGDAHTVIRDVEIVPSADFFCPDKDTSNAADRSEVMEHSSAGAQDLLSNQADATTCPICMEPWTGIGTHRICCLACGHLFGRSCIRRWLKQAGRKNAKCPHCNRKARIEDIRTLYVPYISAVEGENRQALEELGALRVLNQQLVSQNDNLTREFHRLQGLLAALSSGYYRGSSQLQMEKFQGFNIIKEFDQQSHYIHPRDQLERIKPAHSSLPSNENIRESTSSWNQRIGHGNFYNKVEVPCVNSSGNHALNKGSYHHNDTFCDIRRCNSPNYFQLQDEVPLPGAKVFDMDALSQMLLVAQKSSTLGNSCSLNKISMLSLLEAQVVQLPAGTGAVRDIRIAPASAKVPGRLALVASLGKRVSLVSLESNNVVLTYNLQSPSWSCAWDPKEPNYIYAGLQDGSLVVFDLRQTSSPLSSFDGISRQPLHSLHPVDECNLPEGLRRRGILSACSSGVCFWDMTSSAMEGCRPCSIPHGGGVCVALAYNHLLNVAVSTFRPKPCHQQSEAPTFSASGESTPWGVPYSQMESQTSLMEHALPASHFPMVRQDTAFAYEGQGCQNEVLEPLISQEMASSGLLNVNHIWKYQKPMIGQVSPVGLHRSAIVCCWRKENFSYSENLFVFGDETTKALWLWDMKTLEVVDRLKSHQSPVLDVKSVIIGDQTILGCTSSRTLQIYKTKKCIVY